MHSVGDKVWEFKVGDRVASFHEMMSPGGSYAEYAVGWQHTTFHIPKTTSFEDAAALPLAAMTSAIGLHQRLGLPTPWSPAKEEIPLVVYGGASAVGGMLLEFFRSPCYHCFENRHWLKKKAENLNLEHMLTDNNSLRHQACRKIKHPPHHRRRRPRHRLRRRPHRPFKGRHHHRLP